MFTSLLSNVFQKPTTTCALVTATRHQRKENLLRSYYCTYYKYFEACKTLKFYSYLLHKIACYLTHKMYNFLSKAKQINEILPVNINTHSAVAHVNRDLPNA